MAETKNLFASFSKVEEAEDGMIRVYGIASTESKDHDGEVIKASAVKAALPDYLVFGNVREMHQAIAAGTAIEASVDDDGVTHIGALIVDPSTVKKIRTGVLKGFSLGGRVTKRNTRDKSIIEGLKLTEISVVDRPANPDALITLAKFDSAGRMKKFGAQKADDDTTSDTVEKGMYDVGRLAEMIQSLAYVQSNATFEAASEKDGSTMPAKLKGAVQSLVDCLRDMVDEETRELLGGMTDVVSMAKAVKANGLAKASVRAVVNEVIDSLGLTKAAHSEIPKMDDKAKAAAEQELNDKIAKAVSDGTAPLSKKVEELTKAAADAKVENDDLKAKLANSEGELAKANKLAQDLADAAVAKGYVKAVSKSDDKPTESANATDEIEKKKKPTDFDAELRNSFRKPQSPIRSAR